MSKTKAGGSTRNGRDSQSNRLGIKLYGGQKVNTGQIIVRQRGSHYELGQNVFMGVDHTIHAACDGAVAFHQAKKRSFTGKTSTKTFVDVVI
jgi:large subunit ribosomal protein L27